MTLDKADGAGRTGRQGLEPLSAFNSVLLIFIHTPAALSTATSPIILFELSTFMPRLRAPTMLVGCWSVRSAAHPAEQAASNDNLTPYGSGRVL